MNTLKIRWMILICIAFVSFTSLACNLLSLISPQVREFAPQSFEEGQPQEWHEEPQPFHEDEHFEPEEHPEGPVEIHFTADRDHIQRGECAHLEWHVEGVPGVELNGSPVGSSGSREVCPQGTETYWLGVEMGGGMERREVVIHVEEAHQEPAPQQPAPQQPASPQQPAPQQPKQQPKPANPSSGSSADWSTDIAVTDIYPDHQPKGAIYFRITNHGSKTLDNVSIPIDTKYVSTRYTTGAKATVHPAPFELKISLKPGETKAYASPLSVETNVYWYQVTVTVMPKFKDPNGGNNSYTETVPPPP